MAVIRFLSPFANLAAPPFDSESTGIDISSTSLAVGLTDDNLFVAGGRFNVTDETTVAASTIDKISILDNSEGRQPIVTVSGFKVGVKDFFTEYATAFAQITKGADKITGSAGDDDLRGLDGAGNDTVNGGLGNDILDSAAGVDKLNGGEGDDFLVARGADKLTGSAGADTFTLFDDSALGTVVTDFRIGQGDRLFIAVPEIVGAGALDGNATGFLDLRGNGKSVTLFVDQDGGGDAFTKFATIKGDLGTEVAKLIADGVIGFE